ncbi:MAG: DUF5689 domain-containing protein [Chitinophagaceae bacterium]
MKKILQYLICFFALAAVWSCKKSGNYPGATLSEYIALFDVRDIYKGQDVTLTKENMFGADKISAVVVSNHSGGNLPAGLLVVQDQRRLAQLRGIVIPIGADAASFVPGDSLTINIEGGVLKSVNGMLQLTGITTSKITKLASGAAVTPNIVKANNVLDNPGAYEGTLISVTKAGFDPALPPGSTYAGDRLINDGFGNITLHTEAGTSWANKALPFLSNFTGIVFIGADGKPQLRPRIESDITILAATAPKIAPAVITGYLVDPTGTDANYEYIQLIATKNIDFAVTPFSVVTTNNAGASLPTGFPPDGWATGVQRTYKLNLTSGTVQKGQYFYVGANKNIWGLGSTDISSSKWFGKMYGTLNGDDFGSATTNLLANSGNVAGIALFDKTTVTAATVPIDVIFYGGGGTVYTPGPPERGYRITGTDYYDEKNPTTLVDQPYYAMGSNVGKFAFPTATNFAQLEGTYNTSTGRWSKARLQKNIVLTATSTVAAIEGAVTLEQ